MECYGLKTFANFLYNLDVSDFDARATPETHNLLAQKLAQLPPVGKWWLDILTSERITEKDSTMQGEDEPWCDVVSLEQLWGKYSLTGLARMKHDQQPKTATEFAKQISQFVTLVEKRKLSKKDSTTYKLPSLEDCVRDFVIKIHPSIRYMDLQRTKLKDIVENSKKTERLRKLANRDLTTNFDWLPDEIKKRMNWNRTYNKPEMKIYKTTEWNAKLRDSFMIMGGDVVSSTFSFTGPDMDAWHQNWEKIEKERHLAKRRKNRQEQRAQPPAPPPPQDHQAPQFCVQCNLIEIHDKDTGMCSGCHAVFMASS